MKFNKDVIYYIECKTKDIYIETLNKLREYGISFSFVEDSILYWDTYKEKTILITDNKSLFYGTYEISGTDKMKKIEVYDLLEIEEEY